MEIDFLVYALLVVVILINLYIVLLINYRSEQMNIIIGFLIIEFAITGFFVFGLGYEFNLKEKILMMLGFDLFLLMITIGVVLMS